MSNSCPVSVALALAVVGASPACAQAMLQPESAPFNEHLTNRPTVGGDYLVGLVLTNGGDLSSGVGLGHGKLTVIAGPDAGAVICMRTTTQDGRYVAENAYVRPAATQTGAGTAATAPLAWPTRYAPQLETVPLGQVAALARAGKCGQRGPILPTQVGASTATGDLFLQVLANSLGAATWAVLRNPEATGRALRRVRCSKSDAQARITFDVLCPLGVPPPGLSRLRLTLEQQGRDGRSLEAVETVDLLLPGGPATRP